MFVLHCLLTIAWIMILLKPPFFMPTNWCKKHTGKNVENVEKMPARHMWNLLERKVLFDKWRQASKATTLETICELVLLEEFKNQLPEEIVLYLNKQKAASLSEAAVMADEFEHYEHGHFIARCPVLKRKEQLSTVKPSPVSLIQTTSLSPLGLILPEAEQDEVDDLFEPFISQGFVSLTDGEQQVPVTIFTRFWCKTVFDLFLCFSVLCPVI